jgi:hypothetical protein
MSVDQFLLSADTTDLNYPEIRPTLDLNFARVKALDPRITFTRSSGGSYVGADGLIKYAGVNEARFDHDPETGESLGLLVEEARTNLLLRSEEVNFWGLNGTTVRTNVDISPDGTLTSDEFVENAGGDFSTFRLVSRSFSATSGTTYTVTIYAKQPPTGSQRFLQLTFGTNSFSAGPFANFDLSAGTISASGAGNSASSSIQSVGNGWYRCRITVTADATASSTVWILLQRNSNAARFLGYPGDGTSGIYIWGAQLEQGAFPTSYIPTQGSTRTRAADNAQITGKNFSEWYRQDEGSFLTVSYPKSRGNGRIMSATAGLFTTNRIQIGRGTGSNGNINVLVNKNGIPTIGTVLLIANDFNTYSGKYPIKTAISISNNNFLGLVGYNQIITSSTTDMPIVNLLSIGSGGSGGVLTNHLNGTISRLTYFPKRLPNAQLQALTR